MLLLTIESEFRSYGRTTVPLLIFSLLHRGLYIGHRGACVDRSDHRTNLVPLRHPEKQEMASATERTVSELQEQVHPTEPRWTHIALRVSDIDATIAWHAEFSPLELIDRREDEMGYGAWLGMPGKTNNPFILVLAQFFEDKDPFAGTPGQPSHPLRTSALSFRQSKTSMRWPNGASREGASQCRLR